LSGIALFIYSLDNSRRMLCCSLSFLYFNASHCQVCEI